MWIYTKLCVAKQDKKDRIIKEPEISCLHSLGSFDLAYLPMGRLGNE